MLCNSFQAPASISSPIHSYTANSFLFFVEYPLVSAFFISIFVTGFYNAALHFTFFIPHFLKSFISWFWSIWSYIGFHCAFGMQGLWFPSCSSSLCLHKESHHILSVPLQASHPAMKLLERLKVAPILWLFATTWSSWTKSPVYLTWSFMKIFSNWQDGTQYVVLQERRFSYYLWLVVFLWVISYFWFLHKFSNSARYCSFDHHCLLLAYQLRVQWHSFEVFANTSCNELKVTSLTKVSRLEFDWSLHFNILFPPASLKAFNEELSNSVDTFAHPQFESTRLWVLQSLHAINFFFRSTVNALRV